MEQNRKQKILITDDSEMNRAILADMLGDEYEIIEAENGVQAVADIQKYTVDLSLILLDIVMPEMDGFEVLNIMNDNHWIDDIPIIISSSETETSVIERAYELGVSDFISRPFDAMVVRRRVVNTILLYAKQKKLTMLVADQIYEKQQQSNLMIDILSHVMGFKNGESAQHILKVRVITDVLLKALVEKTDVYNLTEDDIYSISIASALHDIGKIGIPDEVLNKPGRFTDEEFAVMKKHSEIGAQILKDLPIHQDEPLVKIGYEICRWHHERYDGRGYPDGLKGDEIPIAAQIVALADVYDALTQERVYKPPHSHEKAISMILNGECGVFNPILLECLSDIADSMQSQIENHSLFHADQIETHYMAKGMLHNKELTVSERTLYLLEQERIKNSFYAALTHEIQFEYTDSPPMLTVSGYGAEKLGIDEIIMDPLNDKRIMDIADKDFGRKMSEALRSTDKDNAVVTRECQLCCGGEHRWFKIAVMALWSNDDSPSYIGSIGKAIDIHDSRMHMDNLERMATHDPLTGLINHAHAKKLIKELMEGETDRQFALAIIDLDYFKSANDTYGHMFGDKILKRFAEMLHHSIRSSDIVARIGGDEYLIFLEYTSDLETIIGRIFRSLSGSKYEDFTFSVSMGVSKVESGDVDYEDLFHKADQALYTVKESGRGKYCFYDSSMQSMLSAISPIDSDEEKDKR